MAQVSWQEASKTCKGEGDSAQLVTIKTPLEKLVLSKWLLDKRIGRNVWIGAHRPKAEDKFR